MIAIFTLNGIAVVAIIVVCITLAFVMHLLSVLRKLFYKAIEKPDSTQIYTVTYKVTGEFAVRVRATNTEAAMKKAESFFEDERFGVLQNARREAVSVAGKNPAPAERGAQIT